MERPSKVTATASGVRATCAANSTGIDTGVGAARVKTPLLPIRSNRARSASSSTSTDDSGRVGSAVIATTTRCKCPAISETSKFENGCPAPTVLKKSCPSAL